MNQQNSDRHREPTNGRQTPADNQVNRLLQAVAECSEALLSDENFESGVNLALEVLGTSIGADRVAIGEQHADSTGETLGYVTITPYEWLSSGTPSQTNHAELSRIDSEDFGADHYKLLSGNHVGGLIETYPEPFKSGQQELGVKATYAIPIMVKGKYWGILSLDFCRTARELAEAEIAVLKTAAACIGSAIQRERNRQAREQAERTALLEQQKAEELQKRDRLLSITAQASQALLNDEDLERAIAKALEIVGRGIDTDRVAVMEHHQDPTGNSLGFIKMLYEWHSPHALSQLLHPDLQQVSYEGIEDWYEQLQHGEAAGGIVEELPEPIRSGQQELGVKSTYAVPIAIDNQYWGVVGFDDCKEAKQRSETEISILKTIAACVGSAIQQNRIRQAREQAERSMLLEQQKIAQLEEHNLVLAKRDRILSATAEASNALLAEDDFDTAVNRALQIIGEAIDTDRVVILEQIDDSSVHSLGYLKVIYEWNSDCTVSQLEHSEVSQVSWEGVEEWYFQACEGKSAGGILEELPEPFRSEQEKIGVKATYIIPIQVNSQFWGFIGIDDCREVTRRSEAELSILKTAAACIGSAIQQERIRRAKEAAERNILLEREQAAIEKAEQLESSNLVLSLRDKWLEATANAANKLLENADLDAGINAASKMLGESLDCDRVAVMQHVEDDIDEPIAYVLVLYEWSFTNTICQIEHPEHNKISWQGMEDWLVQMKAGEHTGGTIDHLHEPFRSHSIELGVKSTYAVPVFIDNQFWGILGIDFCREARQLTLPEIAVFKTAASCIGSAIARQQIQQEKEESERQRVAQLESSNLVLSLRDRWLEATANAANKLLENADLDAGINAALKMLGESLDCDRVDVMQHIKDDTDKSSRFVRMLYEWLSDDTVSQLDHPQLFKVSDRGIEETFAKMISGDWLGGLIDEFPEPFRSGQIELGVKSTYAVSISINNQYWGILGIDFCRQARQLTEPEIAVFKTAASCIGSAIYRQQIQEEKERAELAVLNERNRMAREIHDTLAQSFTGISLQLELAKDLLETNPETARERLSNAKDLAQEGIKEARRSVRALRSEAIELDSLDTALRRLLDKMLSAVNIRSEIVVEGQPYSIKSEIKVELYRIAQEAVTNILRYAQASEVCIQLFYETDTIYLQIKDNGIGFDITKSAGFGLLGMRERCDRLNGSLTIHSKSDRGTEIIAAVPI